MLNAVVVVALLFWFLNRTRTGKSLRAYSDNEDLALLSGIDSERVVLVTWLIVAALATIAGTLYGRDKTFKPFIYFQLLLPLFAAAVIGGLGNPLGAIVGGFLIWFLWVQVELIGHWLMGVITSGMADGSTLEGHLLASAAHMRLRTMGLILLPVLRFSPRGLVPER